ncbi:hypothetical protein [Luteimonas qiangzhengi]|uniref:hypothetical protein n=1 Tax=Luteimonas sp. MJ146 TaxID=3129240 RepID=UPI0031BA72FA
MRQLFTALVVACAAVIGVAAPTAFAQETPSAPAAAVAPAEPVVLRVESGSVMVSQQGAEFVTVESDVSLQPEDRVLVTENAVATLDYGQGCSVGLTTGTAVVAASCPAAGVSAGAGMAAANTNTVWIVAGVAGVAAVAVAASGGSSDDTPPPVSR